METRRESGSQVRLVHASTQRRFTVRAMLIIVLAICGMAMIPADDRLMAADDEKSFGSSYGYRYFVFTAGPLLATYLALAIDKIRHKVAPSRIVVAGALLLYLPTASMLVYERGPLFVLTAGTNAYGVATYMNADYHANLLRATASNPLFPVMLGARGGMAKLLWRWLGTRNEIQRLLLYVLPPITLLLLLDGARRLRAPPCAGKGRASLKEPDGS